MSDGKTFRERIFEPITRGCQMPHPERNQMSTKLQKQLKDLQGPPKPGDIYTIYCSYYKVATVDDGKYALIELSSGNRWSKPVDDIKDIFAGVPSFTKVIGKVKVEVEATIESVKKAMAPEVGKVFKHNIDGYTYLVTYINYESRKVATYRITDGVMCGWEISMFETGDFTPVEGRLIFKEGCK